MRFAAALGVAAALVAATAAAGHPGTARWATSQATKAIKDLGAACASADVRCRARVRRMAARVGFDPFRDRLRNIRCSGLGSPEYRSTHPAPKPSPQPPRKHRARRETGTPFYRHFLCRFSRPAGRGLAVKLHVLGPPLNLRRHPGRLTFTLTRR